MAEPDTWSSIRELGLLSTAAILDRYGISGAARDAIESEHRPVKSQVGPAGGGIILRDQGPMFPDRLTRALPANVSCAQWYRRLNGLVFMWAERERLLRLLNARAYRKLEHDVLTIDSERFVTAYASKISLAHMNSGNTWPAPHKRDMNLFRRIDDYPTKRSGAPLKPVVEVVTDYAIPNVQQFVISVDRMRGDAYLYHIEG